MTPLQAYRIAIDNGLLKPEKYDFDEYIATSDGYGNEFYDGNPIYNFKVDKLNKGVRIIQEEPEESSIQLSAWIEETELANGKTIDELVINMELTKETIFLTPELMTPILRPAVVLDLRDSEIVSFAE